jgi:hypothetical protein
MKAVNSIGGAHAELLKNIKAARDPHGVLAPGRYVPRT